MSVKNVKLPPKLLSNEPWLSKTQKYIVLILGICALIGTVWKASSTVVSTADSRYATLTAQDKTDEKLKNLSIEVVVLGKAFQSEQYDRSISNKQDILLKINLRLKEKISNEERAQLEEVKRGFEREIDKLKEKQKKLDD